MHARDIMTTSVHVIWQNAPVESAVELLAEKSVTALPVVDADGGLVGMVSAGDLLWHRVSANPPAHLWRHLKGAQEQRPATVRQVMSARAVTTTPDADMAEIADMMLRYNVRSVPVVDGRGIVGIVSRRDILRAAMGGDEVVTKDVQHRLDEYADGPRRWTADVVRGVATITGECADDTERAVVAVLARTVPGVVAVDVEGALSPSR
jgi:CBS domain-containing protein